LAPCGAPASAGQDTRWSVIVTGGSQSTTYGKQSQKLMALAEKGQPRSVKWAS
jgi:hypothetical protein